MIRAELSGHYRDDGRYAAAMVNVTPFCCYGNDVDCTRCGAWAVFNLAAKLGFGAGETPGIDVDGGAHTVTP